MNSTIKDVIGMVLRRVLFGAGTYLSTRGIVTVGDWQTIIMSNIDVFAGIIALAASIILSKTWKKKKA